MKASGRCNYDYVVLQATDNSISFYESMGFVRVGAVVTDDAKDVDSSSSASTSSSSASASSSSASSQLDNSRGRNRRGGSGNSNGDGSGGTVEAEAVPDDSPEKPNAVAQSLDIVCSPTVSYAVNKPGDTPHDVARKCNVDVWDVVFLNQDRYPDIAPRSRLLAGTVLRVPAPPSELEAGKAAPAKPPANVQWYTAKENDTPRMIAKMFGVGCLELVDANKHRLEGLLSNSRLREGTRVQVSDFDSVPDAQVRPYAHWSFPDDQFEEPEPSYMMARRLVRRRGSSTHKQRHVEASLAIPITTFEPPNLLLEAPPMSPEPLPIAAAPGAGVLVEGVPPPPTPPKRAPSPYLLFAAQQREVRRDELRGMRAAEMAKHLSAQWNALAPTERSQYEKKSTALQGEYYRRKAEYEDALEAYRVAYPASLSTQASGTDEISSATPTRCSRMQRSPSRRSSAVSGCSQSSSLFNKVVKLKPGAMTEGSEYTYWYVLTFIPDLRWCHLGPMIPVGTFGPDKPKSEGRPKYKLVDESLGQEVDISSGFCIPIKSRSMRRTLDADKEEWDVIDDGTAVDDASGGTGAAPKAANAGRRGRPSVPRQVAGRDNRALDAVGVPPLKALWKGRPVTVRITVGATKRGRPATAQDLGMMPLPPPPTSGGQRKRGRPSISFALDDASALSHDDSDYEEPPRKKRGRPKGSKNKLPSSEAPAAAFSRLPERVKARDRPVQSNSVPTPTRGGPARNVDPSTESAAMEVGPSGKRGRSLLPSSVETTTRRSPNLRQEQSRDRMRSMKGPPQHLKSPPSSDPQSQDQADGLPPKRGRGRPKGSAGKMIEEVPPPIALPNATLRSLRRCSTAQELPAPSPHINAPTNRSPPSTPSSIRSRSQPPVCSRASPGRAAALMSMGVLHSPLVRVRGVRTAPAVPGEGLFSPKPSAPANSRINGRQSTTPRRPSTPEQQQRLLEAMQRSPPIPRRTLPASRQQQPVDSMPERTSSVPRRVATPVRQTGLAVDEISRASPAASRRSLTPSRTNQNGRRALPSPPNPCRAMTPPRVRRSGAAARTSPAVQRRSLTPARQAHTSPAVRATRASKASPPQAVQTTPKTSSSTSRSTNFNYARQQRDENGKFIKRSDSGLRPKSSHKKSSPTLAPPLPAALAPRSENRLTRSTSHSTRGRSRTHRSPPGADNSAAANTGRLAAFQSKITTHGAPSPTKSVAKAEDSDEGSAWSSSRRRHVNSPLVRRSIRNRKGRHVSQRNEVRDAPPPSRHSAATATRKRTRSFPEPPSAASESPRAVHQADTGTGKVSRELLSLLPYCYRPRQRRRVSSPGSRRSVLPN